MCYILRLYSEHNLYNIPWCSLYPQFTVHLYIVESLNVQSNQNKTMSSPVLQRNEALGNAPGTDE